MTTPNVNPDIIPIVTIEPTSEFLTSGFTWPLCGSKYQNTAHDMIVKAAPLMMENMSSGPVVGAAGVLPAQIFQAAA
jgi:hypothetical protein